MCTRMAAHINIQGCHNASVGQGRVVRQTTPMRVTAFLTALFNSRKSAALILTVNGHIRQRAYAYPDLFALDFHDGHGYICADDDG